MTWIAGFLAISWIVDPYGVSPVHISWSGFNVEKPKRRGIDRLLRPYEVWKYQPRTVFLGSSRIMEAIDPSLLDGTRFAPAYNAAVSGNTMDLDASQVEQYVHLDRNLKFVFVELFIWHLLLPQGDSPQQGSSEFLRNSIALHLSVSTLQDAAATVMSNLAGTSTQQYVDWRGNMIIPPGWNAKRIFDDFIGMVMGIHKTVPEITHQPTAFRALDRMVKVCHENGLELYFMIMPNHPYDDYRLLSLGYWDVLEQWHRKIATYPNVLGFSQYTVPLIEPISERMVYWNDPIHPSSKFGELMLRAFKGERGPEIPSDILLPVNENTVENILQKRRNGLERWISENRSFADAFEKAKSTTGNDRSQRRQTR